jgi:hypothetical protein
MKDRVTEPPPSSLRDEAMGGSVLWILLSLVLFALVFLPVIVA